jgi:hypothetical protein
VQLDALSALGQRLSTGDSAQAAPQLCIIRTCTYSLIKVMLRASMPAEKIHTPNDHRLTRLI